MNPENIINAVLFLVMLSFSIYSPHKMLDWLKKYLAETPAEQVKKEWQQLPKIKGEHALKYSEFLKNKYQPNTKP